LRCGLFATIPHAGRTKINSLGFKELQSTFKYKKQVGDNLVRGPGFGSDRSPYWNFGACGGRNICLHRHIHKNKKSLVYSDFLLKNTLR
jgi:hypothetical protein